MFGFIGDLRSMTSGRATFTMEFSHYDPVPRNVADEVIAEVDQAQAGGERVSAARQRRETKGG